MKIDLRELLFGVLWVAFLLAGIGAAFGAVVLLSDVACNLLSNVWTN